MELNVKAPRERTTDGVPVFLSVNQINFQLESVILSLLLGGEFSESVEEESPFPTSIQSELVEELYNNKCKYKYVQSADFRGRGDGEWTAKDDDD